MTSPLPTLPQIIVEAGLVPDAPAGQAPTTLRLNDTTFGLLDTATLGTTVTWTDISVYVISFTITRPSSRQAGPLWTFQAGTCSIVLDNSDGRFEPDNLAGPYVAAGVSQLGPMVPVRVRAVFGGVTYGLFSGFADGWLPSPVTYEGGYAETTVTASDAFKVLAGITLATIGGAGAGITTGARITDLLARASWYSTGDRQQIATGAVTVQATTLGADALSLMQIASDTEIGQLYCSGAGAVVFRGRRQMLTDTRSATVQAVFGDLPGFVLWSVTWNGNGVTANPGAQSQLIGGITAGTAYQASALFYSVQGWATAQLNINWFNAGGTYISTGAGPLVNAPAGTATLVTTGTLTAPAGATQYQIIPQMQATPASSVVMTAAWNHAAATTELSSSSGPWSWSTINSSAVTALGTVPPPWYPAELPYAAVTRATDDTTLVNDVQATRVGGALQEISDAASLTRYLFPRVYSRTDLIMQDDSTAAAWADWVLYIARDASDRFDSLQIDPQADPVNLWPQVLGREPGDRIQVWHRPASVATPIFKDNFVTGITHAWDSVTSAWLTTWTLQDASKFGTGQLTLNDTLLGRLDTNTLG